MLDNRLSKKGSTGALMCVSCSTPETKLILLFSYYCMAVVTVLINFTFVPRSFDDSSENIAKFTLCSAGGYREECDRFRDDLHDNLVFFIVITLIKTGFVGFTNSFNLLYVVQFRDAKEALSKIFSSSSALKCA